MKKILTLLLVAIMTISMVACGESTTSSEESNTSTEESTTNIATKEDMLAEALSVDYTTINNDSFENLAKAKSLYCNATLKLDGTVYEIKEDHVRIGNGLSWGVSVYLPTEELIALEKWQRIVVVGKTTDEIIEEKGASQTLSLYQMPEAYLVDDYFEYQVTLKGKNESYDGAWNILLGDSNYANLVYFADGVDLSSFNTSSNGNPGEKMTILAKSKFENYTSWVYYDATIIAVDEPTQGSADERLLTFSYEDREFFKEYVANLTPMTEDEILSVLNGKTFSMRNNYGGDNNGIHSITFFEDGSLDASYTYEGKVYTMYESWTIRDGAVVLTHTFTNTSNKEVTSEYILTPYQYDDTRYLLMQMDIGDYSMVLTVE